MIDFAIPGLMEIQSPLTDDRPKIADLPTLVSGSVFTHPPLMGEADWESENKPNFAELRFLDAFGRARLVLDSDRGEISIPDEEEKSVAVVPVIVDLPPGLYRVVGSVTLTDGQIKRVCVYDLSVVKPGGC